MKSIGIDYNYKLTLQRHWSVSEINIIVV